MFVGDNVYTVLKTAKAFLKSKGLFEYDSDAEILLGFVLRIKRSRLLFVINQKLTDVQKSEYEECVLRRSRREPVAYITDFAGFMNFEFKVNKNVLIPRPETEILVESVLKFSKKENKRSLLDLCTGSGCMAISFRKLGGFEYIMASDINADALVVAKENARINNALDIDFVKSDVFDKIGDKNFDVIVSNPPYVSCEEYDFLEPELKYEPENALVAAEDGLFFYREIAVKAGEYLKAGGSIFVELNANKARKIKQIFLDEGYGGIEIIKDYAGLPRILKAKNKC
ncbi:MAG: peptide chain release factor N(5)-glutamine methyltransferase [Endomicrobium sp.]|jgi:release factor glutamine methyltransferase|nr:peptide chain release factor N(5)-glutamine methyltransferase [Endomicrobium sp.]